MQIENYVPGLSVDCVIFGFHKNELRILLLKLKNLSKWALPGGFIRKNKDVDSEAARVLKERTGLDDIFLQQFHLFGKVGRNKKNHASSLVKKNVIEPSMQSWFEQRFITVGFYALVEYSKVKQPKPDLISETIEWRSINDLPDLLLDHRDIISKAHETLKKELNFQPIGQSLLADEFTMPELQGLYETILEKSLDRRNFRRKILSYDILKDTKKRRVGTAHKAPTLYTFDKEKYAKALEGGLQSTGLF